MPKASRNIIFLLTLAVTGCKGAHNTLPSFNASLATNSFAQAAQRLERCAESSGPDAVSCKNIIDDMKKYNLPLDRALAENKAEKYAQSKKEKEIKRITSLRGSKSPWDMMSLALEIQAGHIEKAYLDEDKVLIEKAFFEFGDCAKKNDPACMSQYAQMIMYGMKTLPSEKLSSTKEKVLYWLNLSARYGNENARRLLIELEEPIPSPDLAMEALQRSANSLAQEGLKAKAESERQQALYNAQMLEENRKQSFIMSMNYFFPKSVSCTSNKVGTYTYTSCR